MRLCLVILLTFLSFYIIAQTSFTRTYGGPGADMGNAVTPTFDGGFLIAATTFTYGNGSGEVCLVKTNGVGDTLWTRVYGGPYEDWALSVQQTADSGFVIAGFYTSDAAGHYDVYLLRTDALGDTLWTKTYGEQDADEDAHSIQLTKDGGYTMAGHTQGFGIIGGDIYVVKTNANGDKLWTRTYGGTMNDWANSVEATLDGGFLIAGYTTSYGAGNGDVYLVKLNSNGDTLWSKTIGGAGSDAAYEIRQTADSGFIIAGSTESYGVGNGDVYLIKTTAVGDTVWTETYGGAQYDEAVSVDTTTEGGYIIAGRSFSYGAGAADVYLIKTNSSGDTIWTKTFGGIGNDRSNCVRTIGDGGCIVVGYTINLGAGLNDVYLIRLTESGIVNSITPPLLSTFSIFPNPSSGQVRVELEETQAEISIYNITGQQIISEEITQSRNYTIEQSGVYILHLKTKDATFMSRILVVR